MVKSKRSIVIGIVGVIAAALALFTVFCAYWDVYYSIRNHESVYVDGCNIDYNTLTHTAFVTVCSVDENNTVVIPDEVNGCKVTSLGGIPGCGAKHSFQVMVENSDRFESGYHVSIANYLDTDYETYTFNVKLGKNIKKIVSILGHSVWVGDNIIVDGVETPDIIARFVYNFEVASENKTFYSENGKLYYKKTGKLVEEIDYGD